LEFEEQNSVDTALALDSTVFCSRVIRVTRKISETPTSVALPSRYQSTQNYRLPHWRMRYRSRHSSAFFRPRFRVTTPSRNRIWV